MVDRCGLRPSLLSLHGVCASSPFSLLPLSFLFPLSFSPFASLSVMPSSHSPLVRFIGTSGLPTRANAFMVSLIAILTFVPVLLLILSLSITPDAAVSDSNISADASAFPLSVASHVAFSDSVDSSADSVDLGDTAEEDLLPANFSLPVETELSLNLNDTLSPPPQPHVETSVDESAEQSVNQSVEPPVEPQRVTSFRSKAARRRGFRCTQSEVQRQADSFKKSKKKWTIYNLGCAEPIRLESFLAHVWPLSNRPITLVNIGANKGYNLVKWMETWSPESRVNSQTWFSQLKQLYPTVHRKYNLCGTCGYCNEELFHQDHHKFFEQSPDSNTSSNNPLRIIALEPSVPNFELLLQLKDWSNSSSLEMYNYASSNENGEAKFPVTRLGLTTASLLDASRNSKMKFRDVRVITVDTLMSELYIQTIDFLLIDTEGFDPLVLKGAQKALASGSISLIEFEYHGIGPWKKTSLGETLKTLGGANYDCYLKVPGNLVRLTHCFHHSFEFREWSNVLCVHRKHVLLNTFLITHCHWL